MTDILLVRHAVTEANLRYDLVGHSDPKLHTIGAEQARVVAQTLQHHTIDAFFSSTSQRALQTAEAIRHFHPDRPLKTSTCFQEIHMGRFEGISSFQAYQENPEVLNEALNEENTSFRWPEGEGYEDVLNRFLEGIRDIAASFPNKTVCLVTHGSPAGIWMAHVNRLPLSHFRRYQPKHASISKIIIDEDPNQPIVIAWNDFTHLPSDIEEQIAAYRKKLKYAY